MLFEGNSIVSTAIASGGSVNGAFRSITTSALGLGYHTITAEAIGTAGNISPLSGGLTIQVESPPPGQVRLNDAAMLNAHQVAQLGSVTVGAETLTEYGPINANGFTLSNLNRSGFSFISWICGASRSGRCIIVLEGQDKELEASALSSWAWF
jgi:hypothetical protein